MTWLSDRAVDQLREAAAWPELDARYTITGMAGRGGMGTVYVARDHVLDRDVAVKVVDVADRRGSRAARLSREAHILARLDHPGMVPVHDAGTLPDGRAFYVMKLVAGRRLDEVLSGDQPPLSDRLDLFVRVLDAVRFAHGHGIVHRDLKLENIMVGAFGEVYVMDWGLADEGARRDEAVIAGTPGYMPPEQEQGKATDERADIFALGAVLHRLAGGSSPRPLAAIAAKACRPDPHARYQTVAALSADLARFRDRQPVDAYRETLGEQAIRVYRRYELPILLVVAYIVLRGALILWQLERP